MTNKKILFVSQEIEPYLPESEMSRIGRYLPQKIQDRGKDIRTFMPRFGNINERRNQLHEVIRLSGMNLIIDDTDHPLLIKVASIQAARMQIYFIDNEDYFTHRGMLTDEAGNFSPDNDERIIFFARGVIETVKKLQWNPDLIYCQGWFTSLLPIYLKKEYKNDPTFAKSKVVFSCCNDKFDASLNEKFSKKISLEKIKAADVKMVAEQPNYENLCKMAIQYSDGVIINHKDVIPELKDYAAANKPVVEYTSDDDYAEVYDNFFDKILG